ncbi:MAG: TRAP transporter small permease [Spirochaetota bacterium]|nr:TRAP transporter small permease [Spirochaetota bacterium]
MEEIQYSPFNPITIIRKILKIVILVLFTVIIFSVFYQVVSRYVFQAPPSWTEEVARFSLVWLIILGSSVCIRKSRHFNVDYITHLMSKRTVYILNLFLNLLIVGFIAVALYYGIEVMANSFDTTSPALGIPMGHVYLVFPIGFGTMLMEAILLVYELIKYGPDRIAESN